MGLIGSDVNMHFMDPTEHLPISPIYHVIWYKWCTMLWRWAGQAQLQVRVEYTDTAVLVFSACIMLGSNCATLSFSCRNTDLYLFTLKYSAVENEAWDRTQNWYEALWRTPGNVGSETVLLPGVFTPHWKEDLTIIAVRNPKTRTLVGPDLGQGNNKDKLPPGKEWRSQLWGKVVSLIPCAA